MPIEDIDKLFKRRLNSRKKHAGRSVMRHNPRRECLVLFANIGDDTKFTELDKCLREDFNGYEYISPFGQLSAINMNKRNMWRIIPKFVNENNQKHSFDGVGVRCVKWNSSALMFKLRLEYTSEERKSDDTDSNDDSENVRGVSLVERERKFRTYQIYSFRNETIAQKNKQKEKWSFHIKAAKKPRTNKSRLNKLVKNEDILGFLDYIDNPYRKRKQEKSAKEERW